ncbi:hypothetical protein HJD18_12300 [Thermoleophilia bacterium SCSIO 60948]|nr:hypothetical protein HJD18_12300 [Thermoleophilia bacterium SCSIO 60948]
MNNRTRTFTVLLLATVASLGLTSVADAGNRSAATEVTAKIVDSGLKGRLKSDPKCERRRRVELVQGGVVQEKTKTNTKGKYSFGQVMFDPEGGKAFVEAPQLTKPDITCKKGKSRRVF